MTTLKDDTEANEAVDLEDRGAALVGHGTAFPAHP